MAVECTRDNLMELAKCFTGLSKPQVEGIKAYLMAVAAGVEPDRDTLISASECFRGLGLPQLMGIQTYLLCQIANAEPPPPGETDGLIWGPSPETVDSIAGTGDALPAFMGTFFPGTAYTEFSFGNPTTVTNGIDFSNDTTITSLTFRLLETVGTDLNFDTNVLVSFSAPLLQTVGGEIAFGNSANLTSFSAPSLQTVGADISFNTTAVLIDVTLPSLVSVGGRIFVDAGAIEVLSLPALASYPPTGIAADASLLTLNLPACVDDGAGQLQTELANMTGLETLNLAALTATTGAFSVSASPNLASLTLTSLVTVGAEFDCASTSLVSISLPALTTITTDVTCGSIPTLTSFSAPLWVPTDGTTVDFNGCALDIPSVEGILRRLVLAGVVACTIDLSGGTNAGTASLSAQGQADVATLGAQLTINP